MTHLALHTVVHKEGAVFLPILGLGTVAWQPRHMSDCCGSVGMPLHLAICLASGVAKLRISLRMTRQIPRAALVTHLLAFVTRGTDLHAHVHRLAIGCRSSGQVGREEEGTDAVSRIVEELPWITLAWPAP